MALIAEAAATVTPRTGGVRCRVCAALELLDVADREELEGILNESRSHREVASILANPAVREAYPDLPPVRDTSVGNHRRNCLNRLAR